MVIDNQLVYEVIAGIVGLLLSAVFVWLSKFLKSRLSASQLETAKEIASTVVDAIEQMAVKAGWDGPTKYVQASVYFAALAKKAGITLDEEQVKALIEGAVRQVNEYWTNATKTEAIPAPLA